jgi:flagellum-specific ATP synthase
MSVLGDHIASLQSVQPLGIRGSVSAVRGLTVLVDDLPVPVGSLVRVAGIAEGEVVGFTREQAIVMMLAQTSGIRAGDGVEARDTMRCGRVGSGLLGRVVNGLGAPIDGKGAIRDTLRRPLSPPPIQALSRARIERPLRTGVRAVDLMTPLGRGQRMGVFAGPGVGKSTLMGSIARRSDADVNVIALIGERGREVGDFLQHSLGEAGLARSVVVVATGDESPLLRVRAAQLACTIAEHFRAERRDVMLMMDSVTRFAHAQRQIGLSAGEPPATKGYTPSVFAQMALLLERAGILEGADGAGGSITGLYTILVEGDDMTEPVADAARGILDGHLILSRSLAQRGHYPAIDVLDSISRVAESVSDRDHLVARQAALRLLATYRDIEDLVQIGAYAAGSNPEADIAIKYRPHLLEILQQGRDEGEDFAASRKRLLDLAMQSGQDLLQARAPRTPPQRKAG